MLLISLVVIGLVAVVTLTAEKVESVPVPVRVENDRRGIERKHFQR